MKKFVFILLLGSLLFPVPGKIRLVKVEGLVKILDGKISKRAVANDQLSENAILKLFKNASVLISLPGGKLKKT